MTRPAVPAGIHDDDRWALVEDEAHRVATTPVATIDAHTVVYEDRELRERIAAATGVDTLWRFVFAARLAIDPPVAPAMAPILVTSTVRPAARERFPDDLRERGLSNVERRGSNRTDVGDDDRARVYRYGATVTIGDVEGEATLAPGTEVPVAAYLAVWERDGTPYTAGGAFPIGGPVDAVAPPGEYRGALFDAIREVG
ncbi:hypothetical protein BRD17_04680 [Halobacteriales archaeon SW_7_68_16]|nr:MAG: hypothetical protein BRD17_04680 [Halobacteriales archaeon SW_7_68_16]